VLRTKIIVLGLSAGLLAASPADAGKLTQKFKRAFAALLGKSAAGPDRPSSTSITESGLRPSVRPEARSAQAVKPPVAHEKFLVIDGKYLGRRGRGLEIEQPASAPASKATSIDEPLRRPLADAPRPAPNFGGEYEFRSAAQSRPIPEPYVVLTGGAAAGAVRPGRTIVFLPGGGQKPENEVVKHLISGLDANNVATRIVSLPSEVDPGALAKFLAENPGEIIIAGHSIGGAAAMRAASQHPGRIKSAILINPATKLYGMPVPTLLVRGTNDGFRKDEGGSNVTTIEAKGGDHSLRHRVLSDPDKARADKSDATRAMNRQVGQEIKAFLDRADEGR
jgi:hypothetical protein